MADAALVAEAQARWDAGDDVYAIAFGVGVQPDTVYWWRYRYGWTGRRKFPRAWARPRDDAVVALAAKLWSEGIPRPDIASLCGIAKSTLATWRARYHWPLRKPGRSQIQAWEDQYRRWGYHGGRRTRWQELRNLLQVIQHQRPAAPLPKWRCCDQLLDLPACPTCFRKNPLCAA